MKLGFAILSHKKFDKVFYKLIDQLKRIPDASIVVHHDFEQCPLATEEFDRLGVDYVADSVRTEWSHPNCVIALWKAFDQLEKKHNVDWFVPLSANCFPIKKPEEITAFFLNTDYDAYADHELIHKKAPKGRLYNKYRALYTKYLFSMQLPTKKATFRKKSIRYPLSLDKTPFYDQTNPYQGSDWFFFSRKVKQSMNENFGKLTAINNHILEVNKAPDVLVCAPEIIWPTMIVKSGYRINENYHRYINWKGSTNYHPNTLQMKHWDDIRQTAALFARKFSEEESMELIDKIEKELL